MRRSSLTLLLVALGLICVAAVASISLRPRPAPTLSRAVVIDLLDRGKEALSRHDVEGMLSLFTRDARILKRSPGQLRQLMTQAMRELGSEPLKADYTDLQFLDSGSKAVVSLRLEISQHFGGVDASYFRPAIHLVIRKERESGPLGLLSRDEWKIDELTSDSTLEIPNR